jgi:hypothetical protein
MPLDNGVLNAAPPGPPVGVLSLPAPAPQSGPLAPDPTSMAGQQSILSSAQGSPPAQGGGPLAALAAGPGGLFSEIGSNIQARIAANQAAQVQRQLLYAQLIQHAATVQRMADAYDKAGDAKNRDLLLSDPDGFIKTRIGNLALQNVVGGNSLVNSEGVGPTAPLLGMTKDNQGFTQTPTQTTATGAFPTIQTVKGGETISPLAPVGPPAAGVAGSAGAPAIGVDGAAAGNGLTGAHIDPQGFFKAFILPHEGGLNPHDMNGAPTKYGINQTANPGVDVTKLTPDQAGQIFQDKYWNKSGAANLPAPLAAVHADTYFINPMKATQFLQQSVGDPAKYMALRQQWMADMVAHNPNAAKYAQAWSNRNADLTKVMTGLTNAPSPQAGTPVSGLPVPPPPAPPGGNGSPYPTTLQGQQGDKFVAPGQTPGLPPQFGLQVHPDGTSTPLPPPVTETDFAKQGADYASGAPHVRANQLNGDLTALASTLNTMPAGALETQQATNTALSAMMNSKTVRPWTVDEFKQSQGMGEQANALISRLFSNGGETITPAMLQQMYRVTHLATKQANDQDAASLAPVIATGKKYGYDASSYASQHPVLPTVPAAMQDHIPAPAQRKVGATYWGPRGPGVWTGKGWKVQ